MLALRNLFFYWRGNTAVLFGVIVGTAVLTGALFVGDSLRGSLKFRAERQFSGVTASLVSERLLDDGLAAKFETHTGKVVPSLFLRGTVTADRAEGGIANASVIALNEDGLKRFGLPMIENWSGDAGQAIISKRLAEKLGTNIGARLKLSVQQISTVPRASLLGRRGLDDLTASMSITIAKFLEDEPANDFSLTPSPEAPLNLFVPLTWLQHRLDKPHKINSLLAFEADAASLNERLKSVFAPQDWGLKIHVPRHRHAYVSLESEQLILSPGVVSKIHDVLNAVKLENRVRTVYLANWIAASESERIPYSIVAALDFDALPPLGPFRPPGVMAVKDDEIVLTDWHDSPLKNVPAGSPITLTFFRPDMEDEPVETTATFRLAGRIPIASAADDPDLTPPFPGITDKLAIGDWSPPFPFDARRIQPNDANERYWKRYRTTPKAYISAAAGARLFGSRFGNATSIHVAPRVGEHAEQTAAWLSTVIQHAVPAASLGLQFMSTSDRMAKASVGGTDFGGLFLGFSFFLILAALVLVGLLMRLNVERRAKDIGSLLAIGFTPRFVHRSLLAEGFLLALTGILLGVGFAAFYSRGLIHILGQLWPDASVKTILQPHASALSTTIGVVATLIMVMIAIWMAVRGLVRLPIPALLRGRTETVEPVTSTQRSRTISLVVVLLAAVMGAAAISAGTLQSNPDLQAMSFFTGGGLLFTAGLLCVRRWLKGEHSELTATSSHRSIATRNASRFASRSTLTVLLIGAATFLMISVESFRRRPDADFLAKGGGSGGFNLFATSDIPVFLTFKSESGRSDFLDFYLRELQNRDNEPSPDRKHEALRALENIKTLMPLRRHSGDDASCLNLYQADKPRLIGVPQAMIDRGGFKFSASEAESPEERANPWLLLKPREDGAIPVIGEQNSVMWMLKKAVGDEIELPDETGLMHRCRIVATLQDSVFQSELLMSGTAFQQLFPRIEGYAEFLLETDPNDAPEVSKVLETGLRSHGLTVTRSQDRVASYQAVISTYLTTFQLLGGLGLLLGVLGMAAVVVRGVWERLAEFALLRAIGFSKPQIRYLVFTEHLLLLLIGLLLGLVTAAISVSPHVAAGGQWPWQGVVILLIAVLMTGTIVIAIATVSVLRIPILEALRSE